MTTESREDPMHSFSLRGSEMNTEHSSTYQAMDTTLPTITGTMSTDPLRGGVLPFEIRKRLQRLFQESDDFLRRNKRSPERNPKYVDSCLAVVNRALREKHQLALEDNVFYTLNAMGDPDISRSMTGEKNPLYILRGSII